MSRTAFLVRAMLTIIFVGVGLNVVIKVMHLATMMQGVH